MVKFLMRLYQRENGIWYVDFERGKKLSLRTRDEKKARRKLKKLQKKALKGNLVFLDEESTITVSEFIGEYDAWMEKNMAFTTWSRAHRIWPGFLQAVGSSRRLSSLRFRDGETYIDFCRQKRQNPVTINIGIRHVKSALSKAVEWQYIRENPFRKIRQLPFQKRPPAFLSPKQIQKVFESIGNDKKFRLIFALYIYTGARREEIYRLEWKDIHDGYIHFTKTKNWEARSVPVVPRLQAILNEYLPAVGRIYAGNLDHMGRRIKYYLRQAEVGHLRPHDLRHTFASQLRMAGVDLSTIGALLGHKSHIATMIYAHIDNRYLEDAIKKLPY
jgi:integrase